MVGLRGKWSLRNRLLLIALTASISAWVAGGGAIYWAALQEDDVLCDARLRDRASTLVSFAEHEIEEIKADQGGAAPRLDTLSSLGTRYQYQVWSPDGVMLLHSVNASPTSPLMPTSRTGYLSTTIDGIALRVFSTPTATGLMVVQVAERVDAREHVVVSFGSYFYAFLILSLGFVCLLSWWLLRFALRSIDHAAAQLDRRSPLDLTPVHGADPPTELVPMINSINLLFRRIEHAICIERGFISVAAHELRTPLAALRVYAQVASRARTPTEMANALAAVISGVDRTAYLLEQLLDLARIDSLAAEHAVAHAQREPVDLAAVFGDILTDLGPVAAKHHLSFRTSFEASDVLGVKFAITMLMRNLLRNAIAHSPEDGVVAVSSTAGDGCVALTIDDAGPGIAPGERERVFERFYRVSGHHADGVGLGLSIVQSVAVSHGATVALLDSPLGGLRVQVRFPSEPATPPRGVAAGLGARVQAAPLQATVEPH